MCGYQQYVQAFHVMMSREYSNIAPREGEREKIIDSTNLRSHLNYLPHQQ
jgi:hypothetical protein